MVAGAGVSAACAVSGANSHRLRTIIRTKLLSMIHVSSIRECEYIDQFSFAGGTGACVAAASRASSHCSRSARDAPVRSGDTSVEYFCF